jgi:hypothetical protein
MSKTTIRKRIALTATTALFAGLISFVSTPVANAAVGDTNLSLAQGAADTGLFVAQQNSTTGVSVVSSATDTASAYVTPRSLGLLYWSATTGTAQTATMLAGGSLSLYAHVSTSVAFVASGGTFVTGSATWGAQTTQPTITYSNDVRSVAINFSTAATAVAVRWTAPSTAGTYTVSMNRSSATNQTSATSGSVNYTGTLTGAITVTVVATSAGGSYSAANSLCNTRNNSQGHGVATGIDTTSAITNGQTAYIAFDLDDAYDAALSAGNIVVSATGGGLVELAANGSTAAAGTASTKVVYAVPSDYMVQLTQGTANAPQTSTVTISFNGTTVCTKTITIRGEIAKLEIANIGTGDIGSANTSITASTSTWIGSTLGDAARAGLFTVVARDSAGNAVVTNSGGTFAVDSTTLTTTVQALSVPETATSVSSTSATYGIYGIGTWTCGASAGSSSMKLTWTNSGSGTVITSDPFTARCADDPYTYTASWDKASYVAGEIATLTVQFLDSRGNKANNVGAHGAATITAPMFTAVTSHTGTISNKSDGSRVYTFTVGLSTGITAGTYSSIIQYDTLVFGTKQTPTYKVATGADTTTNADVLKSIVALIASINKQIQALQKLILKR